MIVLKAEFAQSNTHQAYMPRRVIMVSSFGKPIVSTIHAGIPEAVDKVLVPENDVEALTEALGGVLDEPDAWPAMGTHNRARAEVMFSPNNNADLAAALIRTADTAQRDNDHTSTPAGGVRGSDE